MNRLCFHTNSIPNHVADLEYLHRYIERTDPGDHWLIRDGKRPDRRHNHRGQAFIRLRTRATVATGYQDSGEYCLARLLIERTQPAAPPRSSYVNTCGLDQCSNPLHWRLIVAPALWRFEQIVEGGWQLLRASTGKPSTKSVVLRARGPDGVVHVFSTVPTHQRASAAPPTALCGASFYPPELVVVNTLVTCKGGC
jgi:hypothetical protein